MTKLVEMLNDESYNRLCHIEACLEAKEECEEEMRKDMQEEYDRYDMWLEEMSYKSDEFIAPTFEDYMFRKEIESDIVQSILNISSSFPTTSGVLSVILPVVYHSGFTLVTFFTGFFLRIGFALFSIIIF